MAVVNIKDAIQMFCPSSVPRHSEIGGRLACESSHKRIYMDKIQKYMLFFHESCAETIVHAVV